MKDYKNIVKTINNTLGWELRNGRGGHQKVFRNGNFTGVSLPASGSSKRNIRNDTAALRRAGLPLGNGGRGAKAASASRGSSEHRTPRTR